MGRKKTRVQKEQTVVLNPWDAAGEPIEIRVIVAAVHADVVDLVIEAPREVKISTVDNAA